MYLADLIDDEFSFQFDLSDDRCDYWKYDFLIEKWDDKYIHNVSQSEVKQLKNNCKRILNAIDAIQGGN